MFVFFDTTQLGGGGKITYKLHYLGSPVKSTTYYYFQTQSKEMNFYMDDIYFFDMF